LAICQFVTARQTILAYRISVTTSCEFIAVSVSILTTE